jgi:cobalt-zinc-cadmium efflux system outer membrane protein
VECGPDATLEIAGQQGYRRTAAEQELAALRETIEEARRQLRAEVEQKFVRVVSLQLRAEMETGLVDLIKNNSAVTRKRFDAGEDTKLDANLAEVELGRARNQLETVGEQLIQARADLAVLLQLPAENAACRQRGARRDTGTALYPGTAAGCGSEPSAAARPRLP